jgi:hypothetical protein
MRATLVTTTPIFVRRAGAGSLQLRAMRMRRLALLVLALLFLDTTVMVADVFAGGRGGGVSVRGYTRSDGTYVQPHTRSAPDGNPTNNYSFPGNYNPNTGTITPGNPDTYLENYSKKHGSVPSSGDSISAPPLSGSSPTNGSVLPQLGGTE